MLFKNQITSEEVNVSNLTIKNGRVFFSVRGKGCGQRFFNRNTCLVLDEHVEDGTYLKCADGWEVVTKGERKPRQPKPQPASQPSATVEEAENVEEVENVTEVTENDNNTPAEDSNEQALITALKNLRGGAIDDAKVREIVQEEFARLAAEDSKKATKVLKAIAKVKGDANEVHCEKYDRILAKVSRGRRVYLHGPAGSGKSHTAEQIARDLGLEFLGQTTIQFAHDVRGYGDAGGNYQDTPFFKAFANGGLYFQDEYDRSNAEAAIVLNSALANGWYDFPVIGRVEAHPNFRFMAAGNTLMKGADDGYITGQEIDPSSRDRFDFYFEVGYLREVELHIAHGNAEIVDFVEDVRQAIKSCGIEHVVSYRATAAMTDEVENENDLVSCCEEGVFKGLDVDARREIYSALQNKNSRWAKALRETL